ncbi:MAG: winged helix-turn-helix transcriptional regulator [Acidobacteria bacterium]|nr:winged helix-turn-helix transcriptional regulator [Acidobacteriota bacterium]
MVQHSPDLNATFSALADPTRRGVLERLGQGESTISELAERFGMTLTGIQKHVALLEAAGLLTSEKVGRVRRCRLAPHRLDEATAWIDAFHRAVEARFDRLGQYLEMTKGDPS